MEALGLGRRFGTQVALRDVTLRVGWGERVAVLGPNGAGKSTLLRILGTLAPPSSGELHIAGLSPRHDRARIRRRLGIVAHQTYLFDALTALENLLFYGQLYDVPRARQRAAELLERMGLAARADTRVRQLSRGMQQRLALARALLHEPDILLLDEPDTGLDQDGQAILAAVVREHADRTVVLTTHHVERAVALCDRAVVLDRGRLVRDSRVDDRGSDAVRALSLVAAGGG
ncbi:MAG: heme ABC exporter ATP-binding protein CcmA [Chloroflexi bacterium]|nr:heme ABC exporter ATP-binding protein CcmA [Chloroflexota bacterium]